MDDKTVSGEKSVLICTKPMMEGFFKNIKDGNNLELEGKDNPIVVVGRLTDPSFSIKDISNIILYDGAGEVIPLTVDQSSIYSEFGDKINSVFISFTITGKTLDKGTPRLVWGDDIKAESNKLVPEIYIYRGDKDKYMMFEWVQEPKLEDKNVYTATVEVVVDEHADVYYLWYLLPIVLIFGLLLIRKFFRKK